jgi:hypothetical protein
MFCVSIFKSLERRREDRRFWTERYQPVPIYVVQFELELHLSINNIKDLQYQISSMQVSTICIQTDGRREVTAAHMMETKPQIKYFN